MSISGGDLAPAARLAGSVIAEATAWPDAMVQIVLTLANVAQTVLLSYLVAVRNTNGRSGPPS